MAWSPFDFGELVPGESGVAAQGTTRATAYLLRFKVTVFSTVDSGAIAALPTSYATGTELKILNRGANVLMLDPGPTNRVETYPIGTMVGVAPGGEANICSFDPPAAPSPRTWWLT